MQETLLIHGKSHVKAIFGHPPTLSFWPSSKAPKLLKAPCKALGPTKRAVPMVARATDPQVRWLMRRPSKRLKRGTSLGVLGLWPRWVR